MLAARRTTAAAAAASLQLLIGRSAGARALAKGRDLDSPRPPPVPGVPFPKPPIRDEADERHRDAESQPLPAFPNDINPETGEAGGPRGKEPTRYGDWERKGRVIDF